MYVLLRQQLINIQDPTEASTTAGYEAYLTL